MADDITLTVRVRDLTRGELSQLRQRLRAADRDMRSLGGTSAQAAERAQRLSRGVNTLTGRLAQLQRTGSMANADMDHMRRTMGLLSRDLRMAARSGDITEEQFQSLRNELDDTRLAFDYLDRDLRRHSAVAQRAARDAAAAQRESTRRQMADARVIDAARRRMLRAETAAYREASRRQAAMQREELRRQMSEGRQIVALRRRLLQAEAAAYREEEARQRQIVATRQQAANQMAAILRRQENDLRQHIARMAAMSGDDHTMSIRFRNTGDGDLRRMARALRDMNDTVGTLSGSSGRANRNIAALTDNLRTMSQVLQNARRDGNLTRRDFNALSNGLIDVSQSARTLRSSGDLTRSGLRGIRRDVALLQAQLGRMNGDGTVFTRMNGHLLIFQRRMRDTDAHASLLRRSINRMGDAGAGGLRGAIAGVSGLLAPMQRLGSAININKRWTAILIAALVLIGPIAQALGAVLVTALGGAFVALGAFALRGEKEVRSAFNRMRGTIGSTVRASAQPLTDVLATAMDEVGTAVGEMQGQLTQAFTATAPLVSNLFGGFTDLAARALPGFTAALMEAGPVFEGFRTAMGDIGDGLGEMFAAMTAGGGAEGLQDVWENLGDEIRDVLVDIGEFINAMSQSATASAMLSAVFETISGILIVVEGAFRAVDAILGPLISKMDELGLTSGLLGVLGSALEGLGLSSVNTSTGIFRVRDANEAAAAAAREHATAVSDLTKQIQGLADLNRSHLDSQAAQAAALTKATEDSTKYSDALKMNNGQLDLTSTAAQEAYKLLSDLASATKESTNKAMEANAPWEQVRANWQKSYTDLVNLADGMGLSKEQARLLAETILGIPPTKEIWLQARVEQARSDIQSVLTEFERAPDTETITVDALTADAVAALRSVGLIVTQLPDGKTRVDTATGEATTAIAVLRGLLNNLDGTTVNTYTNHNITTTKRTVVLGGTGPYRGKEMPLAASGGLLPRFAGGGEMQHFPNGGYVQGPGGPLSDSVTASFASGARARVSNTEFVVRASSVQKYGVNFLNSLNEGRLKLPGLAKGGKVSTETKSARSDLARQFGISTMGKAAGYRNTSFQKDFGKPGSLSDLVGNINEVIGLIKKAFSGGTEKSLLSRMSGIGKTLIKYEQKLIKVNSSLDKATDKLNDLKQASGALRTTVANGVISDGNITRLASGEGKVKVNDILNSLRQSQEKSNAFSSALTQLKDRGVSKTIIEQVAEAGIGGGGLETAQALMRATPDQIDRINMMQSSIGTAATAAGKIASEALYGAGIKAAQGLVDGLTKNQKAIEAAMMRLAKSMEKSLMKALGIKSPSRVTRRIGEYTAEGFAVGMKENRSIDTAWASMLNPKNRAAGSGGVSGAAGGGGGEIIIPIYIGNQLLDEVILDSNRRTVRTRGGNVQAVFGTRTR